MSAKRLFLAFLSIVILIVVVNYISVEGDKVKLELEKVKLRKEQLKYLNSLMKVNSDLKAKDRIKTSDSLIVIEKKVLEGI